MRCLPAVTLDTDVPFWISKSSFFRYFDQQDFMCRDVEQVVDAYLEEWFHSDSNGNHFFLVPPVSVRQKVTQFISGRHRTAVLLRHLDDVPLAFDSRFTTADEEAWLWSIAAGPVEKGRPH
jgi:hypothetical protein